MTRALRWIFAAAMVVAWAGCATMDKGAAHKEGCGIAEAAKCHSEKEKRGCDKPCSEEAKAACDKPCIEKTKVAGEKK